ncbi:MAG: S-methyl-5'-thioinosine phosphorylase [Candidatus Promineifilaceae bacterium]
MPHAIIAGTGIYDIPQLNLKPEIVSTPYGDASLLIGQGADSDMVFLTRHGVTHNVPPHKINYRANISALKQLGVKRVIANYAVGGISPHFHPLDLALMGDIIDFTSGREHTFVDGSGEKVGHVEMSQPYCPVLSTRLLDLAHRYHLVLHENTTYVATNGPRFETPAEIRMYQMLGADMVGMTGMPEVALAREAGMCFAGIALSINWAAGVNSTIEIVYEGLPTLRAKLLQLCIDALRDTTDDICEPARML